MICLKISSDDTQSYNDFCEDLKNYILYRDCITIGKLKQLLSFYSLFEIDVIGNYKNQNYWKMDPISSCEINNDDSLTIYLNESKEPGFEEF